jgi:hypothetical protein
LLAFLLQEFKGISLAKELAVIKTHRRFLWPYLNQKMPRSLEVLLISEHSKVKLILPYCCQLI